MGGSPQYDSPASPAAWSRRAFFAGAVATAACAPRKGTGFPGYAFVASQESRSISAVDLIAFRVERRIGLDAEPSEVVTHWARPLVYTLCPNAGTVVEIDAGDFKKTRTARVGGAALTMRMDAEAGLLWVLCREPRALVPLPLAAFRPGPAIRLPAPPLGCDFHMPGRRAAIVIEGRSDVLSVNVAKAAVERSIPFDGEPRLLRFRSDGRLLAASLRGRRTLCLAAPDSGKTMVDLPLSLEPEHFSMTPDGGQLFVTGSGADAVAIVYPYRTEVAETLLAGHSPSSMAVTGDSRMLFISNPENGEVSVVDVRTHKLIAVVAAGAEPDYVTVTPDNQYALVLNRRSGDMAVIRVAAVLDRRLKAAPLFTMIPVGSKPVSVAVRRT